MTDHAALSAELQRMAAAMQLTLGHVRAIERQVEAQALEDVVAMNPHGRLCGRYPGASNWRVSDARLLEVRRGLRQAERQAEFAAQLAKLRRQLGALRAFVRRHRLNTDIRELTR